MSKHVGLKGWWRGGGGGGGMGRGDIQWKFGCLVIKR